MNGLLKKGRGVLICSVVLGGASCETRPDFFLPPVVATTARVEYRAESPIDRCPSAPSRVQADLETLEALLGVRGPEHLRYSRYDSIERVKANCGSNAEGCAFDAEIYSPRYTHLHETVHVVLPARPAAELFKEGAAVAFSYGWIDPVAPWPEWRRILRGNAPDVYTYGGAFVTYLAATYGTDRFVQFYNSSWGEDESAGAVARKFERSYGVTLDTAWDAAAAVTRVSSLCGGLVPDVKTDGTEAVTESEECLGEPMEARHSFELPADTPLGVETTYPSWRIGGCGLGVNAPFEETTGILELFGGSLDLFLAAWREGKYYVGVQTERPHESFRARAGAWMGSTCAGIVPYPLDRTPKTLRISARAGIDRWMAIQWSGAEPIEFLNVWASHGEWYACTDCDEATCTRIGLADGSWLTLAPGVTWLHAVSGPGSDNQVATLEALND